MQRRTVTAVVAGLAGAGLLGRLDCAFAQPSYDANGAIGQGKLLVLEEGPRGRIIVVDSVTYGEGQLRGDDIMVAASYAGASSLLYPLTRGVKGVI
ncbi:MAG: hypothetical protein EBY24_23340, partial [Betaproteobacteria bacterium]|nr:hypothetical protein [Betaproteobacteria bacterium]